MSLLLYIPGPLRLLPPLLLLLLLLVTVPPVSAERQHPLLHNPWLSVDFRELDSGRVVRQYAHTLLPGYALDVAEPRLCDPAVRQHSGYLHVDGDKHFFYWFFESRRRPDRDPLLLWLNGGPGCSSLTGLFMELGPCRVSENGNSTELNPHSWNSRANIIFLDQPANVGFSYGKSVQSTADAARDVHAFLQLFMHAFPEYAELPLHVFGESYGGHYVPAIGGEIRRNRGTQGLVNLRLDSLGIGNGLVDPLVQYQYYSKMACNSTYDPILPPEQCRAMDEAYPTCARLIQACYSYSSRFTCLPAAIYCNSRIIGPFQQTGRNPYDVRRKCDGGGLCYDVLKQIEAYLNRPDVMRELGVQVKRYESCNMRINQDFMQAGDWMRPYHRELPSLLADGIRVLDYAGDADFICNWYGNAAWAKELEWAGHDHYVRAEDRKWYVGKRLAGEVRQGLGLAFMRIIEAGHMAPFDQPEASLAMLDQWLDGEGFKTA